MINYLYKINTSSMPSSALNRLKTLPLWIIVKPIKKYRFGLTTSSYNHDLLNTRPYMSHLKAKIKSQFSENLVLCIYEFPFNSGNRISKEKRIMEVLRIKNLTYDRNFQLTNCLLKFILILFVLNKQVKQKFGSSHSNVLQDKK